MAKGGAIGIDLGSSNSVIAAVKSGGVDIIVNDVSNRMTPTIVGFGEKERYLGEAGMSKIGNNFRNTVMHASRLLGLSPNYSKLHEETKWLTNKVEPTTEG
jgi:heat shock protein